MCRFNGLQAAWRIQAPEGLALPRASRAMVQLSPTRNEVLGLRCQVSILAGVPVSEAGWTLQRHGDRLALRVVMAGRVQRVDRCPASRAGSCR